MTIEYRTDVPASALKQDDVQQIFESVKWPQAQVPERLMRALAHSEILITAWDQDRLVGIGNVVGDGEFYAYIHWLMTHADYQRKGIGRTLLAKLLAKLESRNQVFVFSEIRYAAFWQQMDFVILSADTEDPRGEPLVAGYRWHPIPGVRYETNDIESEEY